MRSVKYDPSWSIEKQRVHDHTLRESGGWSVSPTAFWCRNSLLELLFHLVKAYGTKAGRICDIGCAQGTSALLLAEHGYTVVANDIRPEFIDYARLRYERGNCTFIQGNFLDIGFKEEFETIILTEVIEHIIDHHVFLRAIHEALKPGGYLVVSTPNYHFVRNHLPSYKAANLSNAGERAFSADGDDHFYIFTQDELTDLLQQCGFELCKKGTTISFVDGGHIKTKYLWKILPPSVMCYIGKKLRHWSMFCTTQWCVARKPV